MIFLERSSSAENWKNIKEYSMKIVPNRGPLEISLICLPPEIQLRDCALTVPSKNGKSRFGPVVALKNF
jgi:hypothetical protein